ncbi:MAG: phosphatase PAP2 family protein [Bacteroidales bacterium]|nr:phosphatase PAP2 family protein [Bacteroidales bacterium]
MKRLIILLALLIPTTLSAQWDTLTYSRLKPKMEPLIGATLLAGATLVSVRPELHQYEVSMYDNLHLADVQKLQFDNYLQFVPITAPIVLSAAGLKSKHNTGQISLLSAVSAVLGLAAIETGKLLYQVERPDGMSYTSFPSGHTYMAFTGAEIIRREFGRSYPWLTYVGYGVAALVGAMRVYNSRHWPSDVLGGVGVALLSVNVTYWLFE